MKSLTLRRGSNRGWTLLLVFACMMFFFTTHGSAKGASSVPPGAPDKAVWVEAEGEAWLGELDTPKEVAERAKRAALNKAVEEARGIFIRSHVLVSNNELTEDLTYAAVRGTATTVKIIGEGWDAAEPHKWTTRLSALVEPTYPESGQALIVRASLSKDELREGEGTKIYYQAMEDCYIYIFSVADDGSVTVLFPNTFLPDNHLTAKKAYEFPPSGSALSLAARLLPASSTAQERVKLIATKKKEDLIPLGFQEGIHEIHDARSTGMVSDLAKKLGRLDPAEWSETSLTYRIVRER